MSELSNKNHRGFANMTKDKWNEMVSLEKRKNGLWGNITAFPARKYYSDI